MKKLYILFLFIFSTAIYSQSIIVSGTIIDSVDNSPLLGANVTLKMVSAPQFENQQMPLDTNLFGGATDRNGKFSIELRRPGMYAFNISFVGYQPLSSQIQVRRRGGNDMGKILLKPSMIEINEVQVLGKAMPVVQNEDTSQFNADAFTVRDGSTAEDLVSKMPGITIEQGQVKSQGEQIQRILVDGRVFFSEDPTAVLRNLPSDVVDKVQIFDQQSEQSRFTGFDDGNTQRTMNIVTRNRMSNGMFGGLYGGVGNQEKYKTSGNFSVFSGDTRLSVLGQLNNTNDQNFSSEDLAGVLSSSSRGGRGGSRGGFTGGFGGGSWGPSSNFTIPVRSGLNKTYAFGLNYTDKFNDNLEVTTNYFFNRTNNNEESSTFREFFSANNVGQVYNSSSAQNSNNTNHRFNARIEYNIDTANSIFFQPRLSAQINDNITATRGLTSKEGAFINSISSKSNSDVNALNTSGELIYRHRFSTPGRTLTLSFSGSYNDNKSESFLYSETISENIFLSDTIDQFTDNLRNTSSASGNLSLTESVHENGQIQLSSSYSYSYSKADRKRYRDYNLPSIYLDEKLSNVYDRVYKNQDYGMSYRYNDDMYRLETSIRYRIAKLNNEQTYPFKGNLNKDFYSFLPSMSLNIRFTRDINLRLRYRTDNSPPSVDRLQNVIDNSNPLDISTGNPELRQDYNHNLFARFSFLDVQSMNSFFVMIGGSYINNYIGNSTIFASKDTLLPEGVLLPRGGQFSKPINLDGYLNARTFFTYVVPSQWLKSNLNFNTFYSYSKIPSLIDNKENFTRTQNMGAGIVVASNFSPDVDFNISSNLVYNTQSNDIRQDLNSNYFTVYSNLKFYWMFWEGFGIHLDVNNQYNDGYSTLYDKSVTILNASISKKLFQNNAGEIKLTGYDLLNNNKNVRRTVTDTYSQDIRSNTLQNYFILSFTYNIRVFN